MGFNNPQQPWRELERQLDGRPVPEGGDGNDSPAWSRKREGYRGAPEDLRGRRADDALSERVPYAELHVHSNFSFLDGASHPEELVEEAARLELDAIALTDHDGMYGAVRFSEAAAELGVRTVYGSELSLGLSMRQNGVPDPEGEHLLVLARGLDGYRRLSAVIADAQLRGKEKGRPVYDHDQLVDELRGQVVVLTGCRKGVVRRALVEDGPAAAADALRALVDRFGRGHVAVELLDLGYPEDGVRNDVLAGLAAELGLPTVASGNVHYAQPSAGRLAAVVAAVRAQRSLDDIAGWLPPASIQFLRSGAEMARIFARWPGAVQRAAVLGVECAFELELVAPKLPPFPVPEVFGGSEAAYLRHLTWEGAARRYGPRETNEKAYAQLEHELDVIEKLDFPGYFLIVWDIIEFCRSHNILAQGRGSAANSAVCYVLGITNADPIRWGLLFERFLAPERDGPPDIDVDIESDRREEAIQYVYTRHGRHRAAQVANVITYRAKSAVRDAAKALGFSPGQQDAWSKHLDRWSGIDSATPEETGVPQPVLDIAGALEGFPRHLGIHSGGMVICDRPVTEVVPVEWAAMEGRTVLQWDKDDCAAVGLVKFDLLGLGMLSAIHYMIDFVAEFEGTAIDLAQLDLADPKVYDMLCAADAVGVFQVESRAQLATLPRLRPREFFDLVIEVALIRPGPIQGGSVHPLIRRRQGEPWEHAHPLLAGALDRTYGVPLFQEQVMQMAIDCAGFDASEADQLRRAMGSKRSGKKMARLARRFFQGAAERGITGELAEQIFHQIYAFSDYGFPESHSHSFALLVYASAWFKCYHPAAFLAGLLKAQPMGFYSPQSLVEDGRRHGVITLGPDINASLVDATLEPHEGSTGGLAVRLGLGTVRNLGRDVAEAIVAARAGGPFTSQDDLTRRVRLDTPALEALATAGAFSDWGQDRRQALWAAGAAARHRPEHLPGLAPGLDAPALPGMTKLELAAADAWATGVTPGTHPIQFVRDRLTDLGALRVVDLANVENGTRIRVGGAVTHRQRPATASGITFLNLEDETGMVNVVVEQNTWSAFRTVARVSSAMLVRGIVQRSPEGVISLRADRLEHLPMTIQHASRDFR